MIIVSLALIKPRNAPNKIETKQGNAPYMALSQKNNKNMSWSYLKWNMSWI